MGETAVSDLEREFATVPDAERLTWLVRRWANVMGTRKRLGESLAGHEAAVTTARAALRRVEAKHAEAVASHETAGAVERWCEAQVRALTKAA